MAGAPFSETIRGASMDVGLMLCLLVKLRAGRSFPHSGLLA
jgi:hypothetical protein